MATGLDLQDRQAEPVGGQTNTVRASPQSRRRRYAYRLRVLGLMAIVALLLLWVFSTFYHEGVVWEWPGGFTLVTMGSGALGVLCHYIPAECSMVGVDKQSTELMQLVVKAHAQDVRSVFAGHGPIPSRWSLHRVCWEWLPSCKSRDMDAGFAIYRRVTQVSVPLWMPMAVIALPTLWSFWRIRVRERRGHCRTCLYDLTDNVSGICPECGTAVPEQVRMEVQSSQAHRGTSGQDAQSAAGTQERSIAQLD